MAETLVTSLSDLGTVSTQFRLVRPDGKVFLIPLRTLTEQEMWELRQMVPFPRPPANDFGVSKSTGKVVQVYNEADAGYIKQVNEANRAFNYRLMVRSLEFEIEGADDEAKVRTLQKILGNWAVKQIIAHLLKTSGIEEADIEAEADSFHGQPDSQPAYRSDVRYPAAAVAANGAGGPVDAAGL